MAVVILDNEHRRNFENAYSAWQRQLGAQIYTLPPESKLPDGRLFYPRVPDQFLDVLRKENIPFEEEKSN